MRNKKIWSSFFANLLGVILGIMLTFGVNALWQKYEDKKKTKEMLILVRNELETNKEMFKKQEELIKQDRDAFKKILEANKQWSTIPKDSLDIYVLRVRLFMSLPLTTSAWQIFQNSEIIQKIPDKELIIALTECYFSVSTAHNVLMDFYWHRKKKIEPLEMDTYDFLNALMNNKESVFFLQSMCEGNTFLYLFPGIDATIDYNISLLDKYGNFRYDMDNSNKEFELFIKARIDSVYQTKDTTNSINNNIKNLLQK